MDDTRISGELAAAELRRTVDPKELGIETTESLEPLEGIIGQERAVRALRFGLQMKGTGYGIYVSGPPGIGKMTSVQAFLEEVAASRPKPPDWCYVYNFDDPYQPRAVRLEAGRGQQLKKDMEELVEHVRGDLLQSFQSEEYTSRRERKQADINSQREEMFQQLQRRAQERGFTIRMTPVGIMLVPVREGKPLSEEQFSALPQEEQEQLRQRQKALTEEIRGAMKRVRELQRRESEELKKVDEELVMNLLGGLIDDLKEKYQDCRDIQGYFEEVQGDILEHIDTLKVDADQQAENMAMLQGKRQLATLQEQQLRKYAVNVAVDNRSQEGAPVVVELNPTYMNLIGRIEKEMRLGAVTTDFTLIKAGALLRAQGGFLVLPVVDLLRSSFSWDALKRALRSAEVRIEEPGEQYGFMTIKTLRPQPIPLDVKVVLVGQPALYHLLYSLDVDFPELFKVKADFDVRMDDGEGNSREFMRFVCTLCGKEKLRHLDGGAVARLMEHAARLAQDKSKLSINFGALADVVREADYWASRDDGSRLIRAGHVQRALEEKVYRSNLLQKRIEELIADGTLLIDLEGEAVGQVNGLSVIDLGDYSFGRPNRITASVGAGREGIVDIERETRLGGPIHSKGVLILGGYLGAKYARQAPLSLAARLVFEQSYEGVEGDSASAAELCTLLSALAQLPVRQGIAMTGSVNQHGAIQPVGGINQKVEGYFDVCRAAGALEGQGVILPAANVRHLMLRRDVVQAAEGGQFHVWAVQSVDQALEILTGSPAGQGDAGGAYPPDSIHGRVSRRLAEFAQVLREFREPPGGERR